MLLLCYLIVNALFSLMYLTETEFEFWRLYFLPLVCSPDDWECFLQYLGCLLEDENFLIKENDLIRPPKSTECNNLHISEELVNSCTFLKSTSWWHSTAFELFDFFVQFDSRMSNAVSFIQKLLVEENNDSVRCPYLAHLEIERRKLLFGKGDPGKFVEDLMQYFSRYPVADNCNFIISNTLFSCWHHVGIQFQASCLSFDISSWAFDQCFIPAYWLLLRFILIFWSMNGPCNFWGTSLCESYLGIHLSIWV